MPGVAIGCGLVISGVSPIAPPPSASIDATLVPATSALIVGQTLEQTSDWAAFISPSNYATTAAAASIASVVATALGSAASVTSPLSDGEINQFSVTVTDTQGTTRVFQTLPRTVVYPTPVVSTPLADVSVAQGATDLVVDLTTVFANAQDGTTFAATGLGASVTGAVLTVNFDQVRAASPIDVTATNSGGSASDSFLVTVAPVSGEITATLTPASSPLFDGQTVVDMADYATMVAFGNFSSTAGSIVNVEVSALGDAPAVDTPLVEGETAGFSLLVTDSIGTTASFDTALRTVEYKARVTATLSNEALIEINPLVPDSEMISIAISGGTGYDGTYTQTAGDLRGPSAYNFADTVEVLFDGAPEDLAAGATLTHRDGLWTSQTGTLVLTRQAKLNGVAIPGATDQTYVLTESDIGGIYTFEVTADDGVNPPVTAETPPLPLMAPATVPAPVGPFSGASGSASESFSLAWPAGHAAGDVGLLVINESAENITPDISGWTRIANIESGTGAESIKLAAYTRTAASAAEGDVIVPTVSTRQHSAVLMAFTGTTGISTLGTGGTGAVTAIGFDAAPTAADDALCVIVINDGGKPGEGLSGLVSGPVNATLNNLQQLALVHTDLGRGGGIEIHAGTRDIAGPVGPTTATLVADTQWAGLVFEVAS